jgi:16S rRNA processing protein RimM
VRPVAAMEWIPFATIVRAHGVRGEVRVVPLRSGTELPASTQRVRIVSKHGKTAVLTLSSVRTTTGALLLTFVEVTERDGAQALSGSSLEVEASRLPPLAEGELYLYELAGARVLDEAGGPLGTVEGSMDNRGQEVLVLRDAAGEERLLPLTENTIIHFDRALHSVQLRVPAGLWDAD